MAKRQREWARKTRVWLLAQLGSKCVDCGTTDELELDVIHPNGDNHSYIEWSWRMSYYRAQFFRNNLAIRCRRCNAKKGNQLFLTEYQQTDQPF